VLDDDGAMSESLYLVGRHRPTFSLGCRPPTGSRIGSPEVVIGMQETARNAVLCAADGHTRHCPAFCGGDVIGRPDGPTVDHRRQRIDLRPSSEASAATAPK